MNRAAADSATLIGNLGAAPEAKPTANGGTRICLVGDGAYE